ncbi:hypothetical protein [Pelagibacterium limicola]|uniref:hypothetical protein n=1 Tax=Pelagibacterium limicola TaxID=2791022 RepID=UPI0018AF77B9|nr:hypothetical protein [Pelagibacterium limicola]
MSRNVLILAATALALTGAGTAHAADWGLPAYQDTIFKPAYPIDYEQPDPLTFEAGVRYWYAMGSHSMSAAGSTFSSADQSHIIEGHLRIDDHSTSSYLKAIAGYAAVIEGTYDVGGGTQTTSSGHIAYAGADFGMQTFGSDQFRLGAFAGYHYWRDNPYMGRAGYMTETGAGASEPNALDIHALRLGLSARSELGNNVDFSVEGAVVPYAWITGTYGAMGIPDFGGYTQGSEVTLNGHLYGAMGEAMIGFRPTQNMLIRAGARAWYLTGQADYEFTMRDPVNPGDAQRYIGQTTGLEYFRWGPVLELTASF